MPPVNAAVEDDGWGPWEGHGVAVRRCHHCAAEPAVRADLRQLTGPLFFQRITSLRVPCCRECGLFWFGELTSRTLLRGWSTVLLAPVNVVFLALNLVAYARLLRLPPGRGGPWGWVLRPGGDGPSGPRHPWRQALAGVLCLLVGVAVLGYLVFLRVRAG
ncbi:hypothetical protein [Streptomyces profundus]|uniref:hypothetical protein n=1 Tax=Streptomyces profundus TaxID=2867410 RepID=UPI001D16B573|nr:hypothetical protein [Streptomyces sp. MA3_2.13]UED86922.1 hypothetical protein K4G22_24225 [Streptomyces sp. MA3_2.13]